MLLLPPPFGGLSVQFMIADSKDVADVLCVCVFVNLNKSPLYFFAKKKLQMCAPISVCVLVLLKKKSAQ